MTKHPSNEQFDLFLQQVDAFGPDGAVNQLRRLQVPEGTLANLIEKFEYHVGVIREQEGPVYLPGAGRMTWYTGPRPSDKCWPALASVLAGEWGEDAVKVLEPATNRIVGLLEHPKMAKFKTKGLVLGYVQSGKTSNYTGVIAKAADRGYRFFIVLAGIHNELRRQTQVRLASQLVELNKPFWHQLTKDVHDFVPPPNAQAFFSKYSSQAVLCVVKKNAVILRKLIGWLEEAGHTLDQIPTLVIDDEADQAAVATATINPLVLQVLARLHRVAYLGYTATPFANLLIDPSADDLYPKDFIVDLPKPEGHFGPEVIFGREPQDGEDPADAFDGYDMARIVPDDEIGHVRPLTKADVEGFEPVVGGQLARAVRWFWLATSARRARGQVGEHSTMLIHTSVRVAVHRSFVGPLEAFRGATAQAVAQGDMGTLDSLREQWDDEARRVPAAEFGRTPVGFDAVLEHLPAVIDECRVIQDNSGSADRLDYTAGRQTAIAVGGNTLSRGLTLEGLISSFFVRSSTAYDTLLQMGRWFGFRKGYEDLPRIWMTEELRGWFRHLALVELDMRNDVARYLTDDVDPLSFATRIRAHPALNITARAKMQHAVQVSGAYGGMRVQTRYFRADDRVWLEDNADTACRLVETAVATGRQDGGCLWCDVDAEAILRFLSEYRFHDESSEADTGLLRSYIERRMTHNALRLWNVAVIENGKAPGRFKFAPGVEVATVIRSRLEGSEASKADIKTLMSRRDAALDLSIPQGVKRLEENDIRKLRREQLPDHGLLVLYPIDPISTPGPGKKDRKPLDAVSPVVVGVGLVFPQPEKDDAVYYAANLAVVKPGTGDIEEEDVEALELE